MSVQATQTRFMIEIIQDKSYGLLCCQKARLNFLSKGERVPEGDLLNPSIFQQMNEMIGDHTTYVQHMQIL